MSSMRILLSLVEFLNLHPYQLDIKSVFLNASLDEVIYVQLVYDQVHLLDRMINIAHTPQLLSSREGRYLTLRMTGYVEKLFEKFRMVLIPNIATPVQGNLDPALTVFSSFAYREKLGSLLYYMISWFLL